MVIKCVFFSNNCFKIIWRINWRKETKSKHPDHLWWWPILSEPLGLALNVSWWMIEGVRGNSSWTLLNKTFSVYVCVGGWGSFHKDRPLTFWGSKKTHTFKVHPTWSKQQEVINGQVLLQFCSKHFSSKLCPTRSNNHLLLPSNHLQQHQLPNILWSNWIHNLVMVSCTSSQLI